MKNNLTVYAKAIYDLIILTLIILEHTCNFSQRPTISKMACYRENIVDHRSQSSFNFPPEPMMSKVAHYSENTLDYCMHRGCGATKVVIEEEHILNFSPKPPMLKNLTST